MSSQAEIVAFWQRFLFTRGLPTDTRWQDCFHFEGSQSDANRALEMVKNNAKRATFTSLEAFQRYQLRPPKRGDLSIVADWAGRPHCVIQTVNVLIRPYRLITEPQALLEGEDTTLEGWRIRQRNLLIAEGRVLGYVFTPDMSLVMEEFRTVYTDEPI